MQSWNIYEVLIAFSKLKFDISKLVNFVHCLNIESIALIFEELKFKSTVSSEIQL